VDQADAEALRREEKGKNGLSSGGNHRELGEKMEPERRWRGDSWGLGRIRFVGERGIETTLTKLRSWRKIVPLSARTSVMEKEWACRFLQSIVRKKGVGSLPAGAEEGGGKEGCVLLSF